MKLTRLRRFGKLRIAWTVTCGIACVLLIALWVRSYWWLDSIVHDRGRDVITLASEPGGVVFEKDRYPLVEVKERWARISEPLPTVAPSPALPRRAFAWQKHPQWSAVFVPDWCPVLITALLATTPWIRWSRNFSLRTLLIATTLVAVVLGIIVWM